MPPDGVALFGPSDEPQSGFPVVRRKFPVLPKKFPVRVSKFPDPLSREFEQKPERRRGIFGR